MTDKQAISLSLSLTLSLSLSLSPSQGPPVGLGPTRRRKRSRSAPCKVQTRNPQVAYTQREPLNLKFAKNDFHEPVTTNSKIVNGLQPPKIGFSVTSARVRLLRHPRLSKLTYKLRYTCVCVCVCVKLPHPHFDPDCSNLYRNFANFEKICSYMVLEICIPVIFTWKHFLPWMQTSW